MENSFSRALEGIDGPPDELFAAWGEDLQPDIVGNYTGGPDQALGEVEVGLRGGRE